MARPEQKPKPDGRQKPAKPQGVVKRKRDPAKPAAAPQSRKSTKHKTTTTTTQPESPAPASAPALASALVPDITPAPALEPGHEKPDHEPDHEPELAPEPAPASTPASSPAAAPPVFKLTKDQEFSHAVARHQMTAQIRVLQARQGVNNLVDRSPQESLMRISGPRYIQQVLDSCARNTGLAISAERYEEIINSDGPGFVEGHFAVCRLEEVRHIVDTYGAPKIPPARPRRVESRVPAAPGHQAAVPIAQVLRPEDRSPLDPKDVERCFTEEDAKLGPINLLDLDSNDVNPVPACLAGLLDLGLYNDLARKGGYSGGGGLGRMNRGAALKVSTSFKICGQAGVFSEPHGDHLGKITSVLDQQGDKLWPVFSSMVEDASVKWFAQNNPLKPPPPPEDQDKLGIWIPIFLEPGSLLIQPPGTIHAPYSLTDVYCTGTMHIDTRGLLTSIRQALVELDHPEVTNDDPEDSYMSCMYHAAKLWKERMQPYRWGTEDERAQFLGKLREYIDLTGRGKCCGGKKLPKADPKKSQTPVPKMDPTKSQTPQPVFVGPEPAKAAAATWFHSQNCPFNKMLVSEGY
ncbi:uncharacterized protein PG998_006579 [Apiospora kogelbergensis]|uniref:uncharacterized protein n=1 Tax=Apiospora kogelbergensis TaxID=1337665 RepID=UPI0031305247